jgi:hypothetical protein
MKTASTLNLSCVGLGHLSASSLNAKHQYQEKKTLNEVIVSGRLSNKTLASIALTPLGSINRLNKSTFRLPRLRKLDSCHPLVLRIV